MSWFKKPTKSIGSAVFSGATPPRPHEFPQLERAGFTVREGKPREGAHWALSLDHPAHGPAEVSCLKNPDPVPRTVIQFDPVLTDDDRDAICRGRSMVTLEMPGKGRGVFREHKSFLRVLGC